MLSAMRLWVLTLLAFAISASAVQAQDPPQSMEGFSERWNAFLAKRAAHPIMRKLGPQLAAKWWIQQGKELWPDCRNCYRPDVVIGEDGLVALEILIDGPDAWAEMAHLLGPRGTAHLRRVDPWAPPPRTTPPAPASSANFGTSPQEIEVIPPRRFMDHLIEKEVRGEDTPIHVEKSPAAEEVRVRSEVEQEQINELLQLPPERVAENLWSVVVTVPFEAVERFSAHPRVVAIAATVLSGPAQFDAGSRRTQGLDLNVRCNGDGCGVEEQGRFVNSALEFSSFGPFSLTMPPASTAPTTM